VKIFNWGCLSRRKTRPDVESLWDLPQGLPRNDRKGYDTPYTCGGVVHYTVYSLTKGARKDEEERIHSGTDYQCASETPEVLVLLGQEPIQPVARFNLIRGPSGILLRHRLRKQAQMSCFRRLRAFCKRSPVRIDNPFPSALRRPDPFLSLPPQRPHSALWP
jgi:hypothetical protein